MMSDWDVMMARFPAGTFQRIDAVSDNRSEFVRGAVEAALVGRKLVPLEDRIERATTAKKLDGDDRSVLLELVKGKAIDERKAGELLGWQELRVSKVAGKLSSAGLIRYRDGLMEAV